MRLESDEIPNDVKGRPQAKNLGRQLRMLLMREWVPDWLHHRPNGAGEADALGSAHVRRPHRRYHDGLLRQPPDAGGVHPPLPGRLPRPAGGRRRITWLEGENQIKLKFEDGDAYKEVLTDKASAEIIWTRFREWQPIDDCISILGTPVPESLKSRRAT